VLGQPRSVRPDLGDVRVGGRAAIVGLGAACLALAALTPLEIRMVAAGVSAIVPAPVTSGALKSPWVLQPVFAGFSILSPSWLWIVMPCLFLVVFLLALSLSGRRLLRVRRVPAWRSATAGVTGSARYTAFGFANPTRRVLAAVLHTRTEVRRIDAEESAAHVGYESDVIEVVETYLYRPLLRPVMAAGRAARRLQSGRLDAYLAYMLIALIAVLAVVTALA
jgi:hydrogenase-4 component B